MIFQGARGLGELYVLGCVISWVIYSLVGKVTIKDMFPVAAVTSACISGAYLTNKRF